MSRISVRPMLAAICVLVAGCFSPDGVPRSEGGGPGSSGDGGSGTTGPEVPATTALPTTAGAGTAALTGGAGCASCTVATPEGWMGPMVISGSADSPACAGAFVGVRYEALTDLAAEEATCSCSCGDPTVDCSELGLIYRQGCGGVTGVDNFVGADVCHDNVPLQNSTEAIYTPLAGTEACDPQESAQVPPATSAELVLCGGTFTQGDCGAGEVCVSEIPDGFDARLCVTKSGDNTCPPAYPERIDAFGSVDDTRGCSACECEPMGTFDCTTTLHVHDDDTCSTPREDVPVGECIASWSSFTFDPPTVSGECVASVTAPSGAYVGVDQLTVCCDG